MPTDTSISLNEPDDDYVENLLKTVASNLPATDPKILKEIWEDINSRINSDSDE